MQEGLQRGQREDLKVVSQRDSTVFCGMEKSSAHSAGVGPVFSPLWATDSHFGTLGRFQSSLPPPKKKERDAMRVWVFQCFVVSVAGFELFQVVIGLALGMVWYCNLSWMLTTEVWILLLLQPFTVDLG